MSKLPSKLPEGWRWVKMNDPTEDYLERRDGASASQFYGAWEAEAPDGTILRDPKIRGPISAARAPQRDYPEDSSHENGNYHNHCCTCGAEFIGHKRRVECKLCYARHDAARAEPLDVEALRADADWWLKGPVGAEERDSGAGRRCIEAIPALLDELEALRDCYKHAQESISFEIGLKRRAEAAESRVTELDGDSRNELEKWRDNYQRVEAERDALKAKLDRVREWAGRHHSWETHQVVGGLLTLIEGKEG